MASLRHVPARLNRAEVRQRLASVVLIGLITGCAPAGESPETGVREALAQLQSIRPVELDLGPLAEALALNTRATEVQRDALEKQLVGNAVQWPIKVYEVSQDGEAYKILSQPVPVADPNATSLLRVLAVVFPQSEQDRGAIEALRTGDTVNVKGYVRGITLRTVLTIHPAVLAGATPRT